VKLPDLSRVNGFEYKRGELILSPKSPMISARRLLEDRYTIDGQAILIRHHGNFYCWQQSHYAGVPIDYLKADINLFLELACKQSEGKDGKPITVPFHPKQSNVNEISAPRRGDQYAGVAR
jgi:hypothetical protein